MGLMECHAGSQTGAAGHRAPAPGAPHGGRRRVLVVDDNPDLRDLLTVLLDAGGYEVAGAPHGLAALELLGSFRPDVIVLDSKMPVMDGTEFARRYRQLPAPHAPILMLTGETDGQTRAAAIGATYLSKPFHASTLLRLVGAAGHQETAGRALDAAPV